MFPFLKPEALFHTDLAMIPFFNVCTGVLLKMKCKLKRALLIWSVIFIQNTKLLVFLLFLVHHIFSLLTCCESWHFPSPVFEGSCSVWVLPLASPQRVGSLPGAPSGSCFPPVSAPFSPPGHPSQPEMKPSSTPLKRLLWHLQSTCCSVDFL